MNDFPCIVLVGFMGAGKTAVGEALADLCGGLLIDLDSEISQRKGQSIGTLLAAHGETGFRWLESEVLLRVLQAGTADVIALGGGGWMSKLNRTLVAGRGCLSVWLDAPFELCWERIMLDGQEQRPLALNRRKAKRLYSVRRPGYAQASLHIEINPDKNEHAIAAEIVSRMKLRFKANGMITGGLG